MRQKNCETQTDQEKGNCNAHENKEEDTGTKELEIFFDNIDVNASPAKPNNTHILYEKLISNLQLDVLFSRQQLKTRDVHFKEEITYLQNQLNPIVHGGSEVALKHGGEGKGAKCTPPSLAKIQTTKTVDLKLGTPIK